MKYFVTYRRKEREIEEEEEAYERRKLEKKLREKEAAYQEVRYGFHSTPWAQLLDTTQGFVDDTQSLYVRSPSVND